MEELKDNDFVCEYLEENFHHPDILSRVKDEIAAKEAEITELENSMNEGLSLVEKVVEYKNEFDSQFKRVAGIESDLEENIKKIRQFQSSIHYLKIVDYLKCLNEQMNEKIKSDKIQIIIDDYQKMKLICDATAKSKATNIRSKLIDPLVIQWSESIQIPIVSLIEDELTGAGFPFDDVTPLKKKDMTDLKNYMILLDQIDLPEHLTGENDPPLPIKILLSPITKRFHYHFYSTSSKLNDCTKPEYYFGSVLKWIQSNRKFISNNLEELFASYSAYFKFAAYLIFLTCEKVEADLNFITEDEIFLHLIDEILSYDNDFLNLLPELVNCKRPIDILSNNEEHVDRWIKIEFVSAAQTMDNIIQSDELWKYSSDQVAVDFLELIQLTTRRCRKLNEETRLKFYFQQLEIIENFRLRMNQIFDDTQSHEKICSILNTVQCIHSSIADWDDISPYNKILNSNPDFQSKHDDAVRNLQNLSQNIIRILIYNAVDSDVCSVLAEYRDTDFIHIREDGIESVSKNFIPVLFKVELHLQQFHSGLLDFVARNIVKQFAARIDVILMEQVFEFNRSSFEKNESAVKQIRNDLENCLFPLLQNIVINPSLLFPRLRNLFDSFHPSSDDNQPDLL